MYRAMMVLAVGAAAAIGCGGDSGGSAVVSCELQDLPNTHWCYELSSAGLSAQQTTQIQAACHALTGSGETVVWTNQPCPGSSAGGSRAGTCTVSSTSSNPWWCPTVPPGTSMKVSHYNPPVNPAQDAIFCAEMGGTWTP